MHIRAVTVGFNASYDGNSVSVESHIPGFIESARQRFGEAGIEVQTARLASQPFPRIVPPERGAVVGFARAFEAAAADAGFGFSSIGPADSTTLSHVPHLIEAILATEGVFGTVIIGDRSQGISLAAISAAADVIGELAHRSDNGFGNLRFAALANCPGNIPFFPAGYHDRERPAVGIAWEAADLAVDAFVSAGTIAEAKQRLRELIEQEGQRVAALARLLAEQHQIEFTGIDVSLAPFPEESRSIGAAFERLGVDVFGAPGTLFIASLVTDVLHTVDLPRTGYSGLMLPVLEDPVLGARASADHYTVNDLLLYSAVCGLGLDVVPLPGDVSVDELRGLLLDVATLAVRLDKPLSARLMPLPGKGAGEATSFDFPYFANTVAMPVKGYGASGLFAREGL